MVEWGWRKGRWCERNGGVGGREGSVREMMDWG